MFFIGRVKDEMIEMEKKILASNAYGHNEFYMVPTPGRFQIDLLQVMKRDHKLDSYKLDNVAEHFLKDKKVDVTPAEIFESFEKGASERGRIAEYCVKDTDLPQRLINKLAKFPNMIEMAKVTCVPISYLITRGQQIKVFSQLVRETTKLGYLCPILRPEKKDEKREGENIRG